MWENIIISLKEKKKTTNKKYWLLMTKKNNTLSKFVFKKLNTIFYFVVRVKVWVFCIKSARLFIKQKL